MTYARPLDRAGALRLHLNENTGGCSATVLDAIRQISAEDVAKLGQNIAVWGMGATVIQIPKAIVKSTLVVEDPEAAAASRRK